MLLTRLSALSEKYNWPKNLDQKLKEFLLALRINDAITSTLASRHLKITPDLAKDVLTELVNNDILSYFILVPCTNENENYDIADAIHYVKFNSLDELNACIADCAICQDCGSSLNAAKAKIGFMINKESLHAI